MLDPIVEKQTTDMKAKDDGDITKNEEILLEESGGLVDRVTRFVGKT